MTTDFKKENIPDDESIKTTSKKDSKSKWAIDLMKQHELFHDKNKMGYTTIKSQGKNITYPTQSEIFRDWIQQQYFLNFGEYLSKYILTEAIENIDSKAKFSEKEHLIYHRVAEHQKCIWIDLGNQNHQYIRISKDSWEVVTECPIKFIRDTNMQELPNPINGSGDLSLLWRNINIPDESQILVLAWMLECFRPSTAFPVLFLTGTQGSAKSTTQERIKQIIDPSGISLRVAPQTAKDLMIAAANNYLLSFNNMSYLNSHQQDGLCCVSTGGGYATREFYTTCDERAMDIKRPVIMNGITDIITAPDLLERSIIIHLPKIPSTEKIAESELNDQFEKDRPFIFTALLDLWVKVLNQLPFVVIKKLPRMGDFAKLGTAIAMALEKPENYFLEIFECNQDESQSANLENSPVIGVLIDFFEMCLSWEGTYQMLLCDLTRANTRGYVGWPKSPKGLACALARNDAYLAKLGIKVEKGIRTKKGYRIRISARSQEIKEK